MILLSVDDLLILHTKVIEFSGGSLGVRDAGRLEAVIATQKQEVFGVVLYKNIHEKAAAILRGVVADHPFVDGNKRTAALAALTLLEINKVDFKVSQKQLEDFAVSVATKKLEVQEIAEWLQNNSKPY